MSSQRGFSIVQSMVFAGILSASALVVTKLVSDLKMTQKSAETRDDIEVLHTTILSSLQDVANCTATLSYNTSATPGSRRILLSSNDIIAQEGQVYMNGRIRLDKIILPGDTPPPALPTAPDNVSIIYSRLKSDGVTRLGKGYGAQEVRKNFPLQMVNDPGGTRCYLNQDQFNSETTREFCESLGSFMIWDAINNRCNLNSQQCPADRIFVGIDATGNKICSTLNEALPQGNIFDTTSVASCPGRVDLNLSVNSNKIRINCNGSACTVTAPDCAARRASTTCGVDAGVDNCGNACGLGTNGVTVNSEWNAWGAWDACDPNNKTRTRSCDNAMACGGTNNCVGVNSQTQSCLAASCTAVTTTAPAYCSTNTSSITNFNILDSASAVIGTCTNTDDCPLGRKLTDCPAGTNCPVACVTAPGQDCNARRAMTCTGVDSGTSSCGVACGLGTQAPVAGEWTAWSAWSPCVLSSQSRSRSCTNPSPVCGGASCVGMPTESQACTVKQCTYTAGTPPMGDPACLPGGVDHLIGDCVVDSDCPPRPAIVTSCPTQPVTFHGCGVASTCTPTCPDPSTVCIGSTFVGPNGCSGTCNVVGTSTTPSPGCMMGTTIMGCETRNGESVGIACAMKPSSLAINHHNGVEVVVCNCEIECGATGDYCVPETTGSCGADANQCQTQGGPMGCSELNTIIDGCGFLQTRCTWEHNYLKNCM